MRKEKVDVHKNPVVRFENKFFDVDITKLTEAQTNLFMAIVSQISKTEDYCVRIPFETLRTLSNYRKCTKNEFLQVAIEMRKQLRKLEIQEDSACGDWFPLFEWTRVDEVDQYLLFQLNDISANLFFNLTRHYTQFFLQSFVELRGVYAKRICLHLLKFKSTGYWTIDKEEFVRRIGVPKSYSSRAIQQWILTPAIKGLSPLFPGLEVTPTYGGKRNRTIVGYEFRFEK